MCDAQWSKPEPLVEACRPKAKTPPQDLQRTLSAILWRHQNGEPRRVSRRLLILRGWSHDEANPTLFP